MNDEKGMGLKALVDRGVHLVRAYNETDKRRTDYLKALAEVIVALREQFDYEGRPDWAGRSWEYRTTVASIYEMAGIPPSSTDGLQSSLRYHVGNLLRERLTPEQLSEAGLLVQSPRERVAEQRTEAAVARIVVNPDGGGGPIRGRTPARLESLYLALEQVAKDIRARQVSLDGDDYDAVMDLLSDLSAQAATLRHLVREYGAEDAEGNELREPVA